MKTKCVLFLTVFFLAFLALKSQTPQVYIFQKDDTVLKKQYFEQAVKQHELVVSTAGTQHAKDYKTAYENQFKQIGELLQSSRAVTAPEANGYLQAVLQKIVVANDELKGRELRVIFTRDWWPNAYSMGDGTIAINAGLVIFLENEAELSFVLCHELSHYYLQHTQKSIKKYVETINSDSVQKELKKLYKQEYRVNQRLEELAKSLAFDSRQHSRSNETEADAEGFKFMQKAGYNCSAIRSCLLLLDKIDDSLLYKPLNLEQVFNFSDYPFKKRWIEKESGIFSRLNENESPEAKREKDSLKTHPDCSTRILMLSDSLQNAGEKGGNFLVSENVFNKLKKDLFVELTEQCYRSGNLSRNLYYSLHMLQTSENTYLAVYSIARCLNQLYENQKDHRLGTTIDAESKIYPEDYNLLLRMLGRLKLDELSSLNYFFCKSYYEQMRNYPNFRDELKKLQKPQN